MDGEIATYQNQLRRFKWTSRTSTIKAPNLVMRLLDRCIQKQVRSGPNTKELLDSPIRVGE